MHWRTQSPWAQQRGTINLAFVAQAWSCVFLFCSGHLPSSAELPGKKLEWSGIGWMFSKRFGPEPSAEPQTNCGALLYCLLFSLFAFSRFPIWFPLFVYICIYTHIYSSAFPFCFRNHRSPHGLLLNCFSVSVSTYGRRATACDLIPNAFKLFQPD